MLLKVAKRALSLKPSYIAHKNRTTPPLATLDRFWSSKANAISLDDHKRHLTLHFKSESDKPDSFPYTWLRENCRCKGCFEPSSLSRVVSLTEFPEDVKPKKAEVTQDGDCQINWSDGHKSLFPKEFLREHSFDPESRQQHFERESFQQELWTSTSMAGDFPRADYKSVMESDEALLDYLLQYSRYGFVILSGVPIEKGHIKAMQNRVAFERMTHYGSGYFVEVKENPSNIAYTNHRLSFHNDLAHYEYMPSSIYLHCIVQHTGIGGESLLVDGFKVSSIMREKHPEQFKLLTDTIFQFRDIGTDYTKFYTINRAPTITFDYYGNLNRINWAHLSRDPRINMPLDQVEPLYAALRTFENLINDPTLHIEYKMEAGEMITFSNTRLLHGRTELTGKGATGARMLQGGYVDWDEISSRIRVLQMDLGKKSLNK